MDTKIIKMLISFVVSIFLSSCMQGPSFLSQKMSDKDDELNLTYEKTSAEVTDEDGNSFEISTEVPEGLFTTGSLVISSALSMSSEIDLEDTFSITGSEDMSASVSVSSSEDVGDASVGSIYITIPYSAASLALAESTIAIAYHVTDSLGETWAGLMLKDEYQETDAGLRFALKGMGNYQIIKIPGVMSKPKVKKMARKPRNRQQAQEETTVVDSPVATPMYFNGVPSEHLLVWLDASDIGTISYYDGNGGLMGVDGVSTPEADVWENSFNEGMYDFSYTPPPSQYREGLSYIPSAFDGNAALTFKVGTSHSSSMEAQIPELQGNVSFHYFVVAVIKDAGMDIERNQTDKLVTFVGNSGNGHELGYYGNGTYEKIKLNGDNPGGGPTEYLVAKNEPVILEVSYDHISKKLKFMIGNALISTDENVNLNLTGDVQLSHQDNANIDIEVSDFLVFDRELTPQMRQDVQNVLDSRIDNTLGM